MRSLRLRPFITPALTLFALGASSCTRAVDGYSEEQLRRAEESAQAVDGAALSTHVEQIFAGRQTDPSPDYPCVFCTDGERIPYARRSSVDYLVEQLRTADYQPVVETIDRDGFVTNNVWVELPGDGTATSKVLVTAHHDAWYRSGADDNASALAVLLELARVLRGQTFRHPVRILAFDGEEIGFVGAHRYRDAHRDEAIAMVLNMDCVGFASNAEDSQDAPTGFDLRDVGNFLAVIGNRKAADEARRAVDLASGLPEALDTLGIVAPGDSYYPATYAFLRSDHSLFWKEDVPALFLTDTADLRNPNYHTETDTPDTLDYAFLSRVARFVAALTTAIANGP